MASVNPSASSPYVLTREQEQSLLKTKKAEDSAASLYLDWLHQLPDAQAQQIQQAAANGSLSIGDQSQAASQTDALIAGLQQVVDRLNAVGQQLSRPQDAGDASPSASSAAGATGVAGVSNDTQTADGYTVDDCVRDMDKLQHSDNLEGGQIRSPAELRTIAQGIIKGINANFSGAGATGKDMAHELIASAWKESKFDVTRPNGGVFQCAQNRLDDYNKAHGTNITQAQLSSGDPALGISVSLWAMAHPAPGLGAIAGVPMPTDPGAKALYLWNYNDTNITNGQVEIADYMEKTRAFRKLIEQ